MCLLKWYYKVYETHNIILKLANTCIHTTILKLILRHKKKINHAKHTINSKHISPPLAISKRIDQWNIIERKQKLKRKETKNTKILDVIWKISEWNLFAVIAFRRVHMMKEIIEHLELSTRKQEIKLGRIPR